MSKLGAEQNCRCSRTTCPSLGCSELQAVLTKVTSRLDDASSPVEKQAAVGLARPSPGITAAHKGGGDLNGVANGAAGGSGHGHRRTSSAGSQGLPSLARLFVKPSPRPEQPEQVGDCHCRCLHQFGLAAYANGQLLAPQRTCCKGQYSSPIDLPHCSSACSRHLKLLASSQLKTS